MTQAEHFSRQRIAACAMIRFQKMRAVTGLKKKSRGSLDIFENWTCPGSLSAGFFVRFFVVPVLCLSRIRDRFVVEIFEVARGPRAVSGEAVNRGVELLLAVAIGTYKFPVEMRIFSVTGYNVLHN